VGDFSYIAINKEGKEIKGSIQAENINTARFRLKTDGLVPIRLKEQSLLDKDISFGFSKKVKSRDLSIFCRQFTSILNAGVTVVDALRMMGDQTPNKPLKKAIIDTRERVQQGQTLTEAMMKSPKVFPTIFVNMVEAGEASGNLDMAVNRMGIQFEKSAKLSGLVKKAMIYPVVMFVVAIFVTIIMSVVVVPKFASMFEEMGSELPLATRIIVGISNVLIHRWYVILAILVMLILLTQAVARTEKGKIFFGTLAIKIPIFGKLNIKSYSAKFARTLSTLVSSGISITVAIEITAKTMTNILFYRAMLKAKEEVEQGVPLSVPIRKAQLFPPLVYNMLAIGEETGNIEGMLDKVAEYFEEETELATASLAELMQPVIIVVLGVIIGGLVLAMYQPMISIYGDLEQM
jgi:type IV pilus assembly protein PilC